MRRRTMGADGKPLPFDLVHRDKASLAVDLKTAEGREIVRKLAQRSDVFVENFRGGALQKAGLGYEDLREDCPNLVYCSISGFGQFGPMRDMKGVDLIAQAYGGLLSVTGTADGQLAKAGFPVADLGTGMWGAIGVLAALLRARAAGCGSYVDVSLADTIAAWSLWEIADYASTSAALGPLGTAPARFDHYQLHVADVAMATGMYADLGFRVSEYASLDATPDTPLFASFNARKGNANDIVLVANEGPRLHHFGYVIHNAPSTMLRLCDLASALGYSIDYGPSRDGIGYETFLYLRDPDGHRIELLSAPAKRERGRDPGRRARLHPADPRLLPGDRHQRHRGVRRNCRAGRCAGGNYRRS
jgi:catechol 2,3-dioxygenase-like lactoylglutathione lyase family enzyme